MDAHLDSLGLTYRQGVPTHHAFDQGEHPGYLSVYPRFHPLEMTPPRSVGPYNQSTSGIYSKKLTHVREIDVTAATIMLKPTSDIIVRG